jgi:hypothetical protein
MKGSSVRILSVVAVVVLVGTLIMSALPARPASADGPVKDEGQKKKGALERKLDSLGMGAALTNEASLPVTVAGWPEGTLVSRWEQQLGSMGTGPDGVPFGTLEGAEPFSPNNAKVMQILVPTAKFTAIYAWDPKNGYKLIDVVFPMVFKTSKAWVDYTQPFQTARWEIKAGKEAAMGVQEAVNEGITNGTVQFTLGIENLMKQEGFTPELIEANVPSQLTDAGQSLAAAAKHLNEAAGQLKDEIDAQIKSGAASKLKGMDASQMGAGAVQLEDAAKRLEELTASLKTLRASTTN